MKIVIMCGGRGKRMGHLTDDFPKPLSLINDKPVLGLKIEQYINQGFKDFIFCIGYKGVMIKEYIKKNYDYINAEFYDSGISAGILKRLYDVSHLYEKSIVMTYGDTISKINLNDFIESHKNSDNQITLTLAKIKNPFGIVEFNNQSKITLFREKPVFHYYIGYAIIDKNVFSDLNRSLIDYKDGEGIVALFSELSNNKKLGSYIYSGRQLTFNTIEEYDKAKKRIKEFYTYPEGGLNE